MKRTKLSSFYQNIETPIVVIENEINPKIIYENKEALLLLPPVTKEGDTGLKERLLLPEKDYEEVFSYIRKGTAISEYITRVQTTREDIPVTLYSSNVNLDGEELTVLSIYKSLQRVEEEKEDISNAIKTILNIAYKTDNVEDAINNILSFAGSYVDVNRAYIFESVSETLTSNTYEWCAPGTEPAIWMLQNLPKEDYTYDEIVGSGLLIAGDIREMSREDRDILEPQGIKALAIITIYNQGVPLGYVGFDDCEKHRTWTRNEINLLKELGEILGSVFAQRDMQRGVGYALGIMETVANNTDSIVYVNDIDTYEILFVNQNTLSTLGLKQEEVIGRKCYEIMQDNMKAPCGFCPMKKMVDADGNILKEYHRWEFKNTVTGKWYLIRDAVAKWIDGRNVHIETASEITNKNQYESYLDYINTIDVMTGTYTKTWGEKTIHDIMDNERGECSENSLIFVKVDGLGEINTKYSPIDGDFVIIKTAEIIKSNIRKSDMICRWAGNEFVIVVRGDYNETGVVMRNIMKLFDEYNDSGEVVYKLAFHYGIVEFEMGMNFTASEVIEIAKEDMKEYSYKE